MMISNVQCYISLTLALISLNKLRIEILCETRFLYIIILKYYPEQSPEHYYRNSMDEER